MVAAREMEGRWEDGRRGWDGLGWGFARGSRWLGIECAAARWRLWRGYRERGKQEPRLNRQFSRTAAAEPVGRPAGRASANSIFLLQCKNCWLRVWDSGPRRLADDGFESGVGNIAGSILGVASNLSLQGPSQEPACFRPGRRVAVRAYSRTLPGHAVRRAVVWVRGAMS